MAPGYFGIRNLTQAGQFRLKGFKPCRLPIAPEPEGPGSVVFIIQQQLLGLEVGIGNLNRVDIPEGVSLFRFSLQAQAVQVNLQWRRFVIRNPHLPVQHLVAEPGCPLSFPPVHHYVGLFEAQAEHHQLINIQSNRSQMLRDCIFRGNIGHGGDFFRSCHPVFPGQVWQLPGHANGIVSDGAEGFRATMNSPADNMTIFKLQRCPQTTVQFRCNAETGIRKGLGITEVMGGCGIRFGEWFRQVKGDARKV